MSDKKIKTIIVGYYFLPYMGGKSRIGKFIMDYIPTDTKKYVEVFGGMFWVYFNLDLDKYDNLEKVVYNDFNPLNANLFRCVRNHERFRNKLDSFINRDAVAAGNSQSVDKFRRNLFRKFKDEIFSPDSKIDLRKCDYDKAYKYAYVLTQVFSGANPAKGTYVNKNVPPLRPLNNKLFNQEWINHFDKITDIRKKDFQDVIKEFDSKNTFFYCDPPYYGKEHYYDNHEFTLESHKRLADILKKIDGKFALSYYEFPELLKWYPKNEYTWVKKEFTKQSSVNRTKGTEILIMNYPKKKKKKR